MELSAQINVMLRIKEAEDKLRADKEILEEQVQVRTRELTATNKKLQLEITERKQAEGVLKKRMNELEIFNDATVGRELKMLELKKEINELLEKSGQKPKYEIPV